MRNVIRSAAIAAFLSGVAVSSAHAQIVNGNFNSPNGALFGWQENAAGSASGGPFPDGGRNARFNNAADSISQTLTNAAGQYVIRFYISAFDSNNSTGTLNLLINNVLFATFNALGVWQQKSTSELALTANTTIQFTGATFGGNQSSDIGLDNVEIVAVPGPIAGSGILSFALLGLFGLGRMLRSRRSNRDLAV